MGQQSKGDDLVCRECGARDGGPQHGWQRHILDDEHLVWTCPHCSAVHEAMTEKVCYALAHLGSYSTNN
jgi:hypothetical protein